MRELELAETQFIYSMIEMFLEDGLTGRNWSRAAGSDGGGQEGEVLVS
jgi:hypothetical protein